MADDFPSRAFDVRVNWVGDSMLLVQGLDAYEIDEVGRYIWEKCDGRHSLEEIAATVAAEYAVTYDAALEDARTFLRSLGNAGLVT